MNNAKGFTIIELMIVIIILGLLVTIALPNFISMKNHAREAGTLSSAHTLQLVTEDYAAMHSGTYSVAAGDLTPMLPGGGLMTNAFTDAASEPQFGAPAAGPGQVGLEGVMVGGNMAGYRITGYGRSAVIITLSNI